MSTEDLKKQAHDLANKPSEAIAVKEKNTPENRVMKMNVTAGAMKKTLGIIGLEDIPTSEVPLPKYLIIQPGTPTLQLASKEDSSTKVGMIYNPTTLEVSSSLKFYLLRVKNMSRTHANDNGVQVVKAYKMLAGIDQDGMTPFAMSFTVGMFGAFSALWGLLTSKTPKITKSWEYGITMTVEKVETQKVIDGKQQNVKYYVPKFEVDDSPADSETLTMLDTAFSEFGASIERNEQVITPVEVKDTMPF
jgi:hypothetical protein